tara:strand:+ start:7150 stop:8343 length:1194 start_codon:yes stop_codon:yes gene_type:complete
MYDIAIIGGGIIGLSTAYELLKDHPNKKIIVLEKENSVAKHQTGHNSGVIHSGIYYKPNTLKAINCRRGIDLLKRFCSDYDVKYEICGKLIIASNKEQLETLKALYDRGIGNGIKGLKIISGKEINDYEPYAIGEAAIYCPETGIVDYSVICKKLSELIKQKGEIATNFTVKNIHQIENHLVISSDRKELKSRFLINCAGLFSDRISSLSGLHRNYRIIPFRGEYFMIKRKAEHLVNNLIYPVPDPRYPFLGVHFTRTIDGKIEAGPNAVLAFAREGYEKLNINIRDMWDYLSFQGFWKMAGKYWSTGLEEHYRSLSKKAFLKSLQKLIPLIKKDDLESSSSGVRAQALGNDGCLVDDFVFKHKKNMIHVINAPSPAATSSFSIGLKIRNLYNSIHE